MTGIDGIGWAPATTRAANRPGTKASFVVPTGSGAAAGTASAAPLVATGAAGSILTLQEQDGETLGDREARRRGQDILSALAELQRALLAGNDDPDVLQRLAALADAAPCATDRRLRAMLAAIVVRARVELARRQA